MDRKPFVGGNWKCTQSIESITTLLKLWGKKEIKSKADVVIAPSAIYIPFVKQLMRKDFQVCSQNCYMESGAFTGEISVDMLEDFDIPWCIVGHSERRQIFKESDELLAKKVKALEGKKIKVIGCIGETLKQRKAGNTEAVLLKQTKYYVDTVKNWDNFVLAYEPIWAIGTGETASPKQAQDVHKVLRAYIKKNVSAEVAKKLRIIYGGSVKDHNCAKLIAEKDIDGFLVGGASTKENFDVIINSTK